MRASVTVAAITALGLGIVAPAVAAAAPAGGGAQLCVDRFADYNAVLQWPSRGGQETFAIRPGQCSDWGPANAGELIVVLANYRGAQINIGHFTATGRWDSVEAVGRIDAGTEGINLGV